nr:hypothetical protein [uncultured Lachnoanaerobaculum sp.]
MELCINVCADIRFQFNGDAVIPDDYLLSTGDSSNLVRWDIC